MNRNASPSDTPEGIKEKQLKGSDMKLVKIFGLAAALSGASSAAMACNTEEVALLVGFMPQEGQEETLEKVLLDLAEQSSTEPGVAYYAPYLEEQTGTYYLIERYESVAVQKKHVTYPHFKAIFPKIPPLLKEPLKVTAIKAVCGE